MSEPFMDREEAKRRRYHATPGGLQWSPAPRQRVDKTRWQTCDCCGRQVPAVKDWLLQPDGTLQPAGTCTYVCPYCNYCHVGTPQWWNDDVKCQEQCHECGTGLDDAYQCPQCGFPRTWMRVTCPYCGNKQPVSAPHWVVHCDVFTLECVHCESVFCSLCIC
jgi:hypothetical protein